MVLWEDYRFIENHELKPQRLGLAVPGLVAHGEKIETCDVLPAFVDWYAVEALRAFCDQCVVLNDVEAALIEEMHDTPMNSTAGVIMVGTAVGAAFITEGRPLLGTCGWAGELGYIPISFENNNMQTVVRLDDIAGGSAIAKRCHLTPEQVALHAQTGDALTLATIQEAAIALGLGLATVINLFNPARLAIGGGTCELPGYWETAYTNAKQHSLPDLWKSCTVSKVKAGKAVAALGALRSVDAKINNLYQ